MLAPLLTFCLWITVAPAGGGDAPPAQPPGTVFVPGGQTLIGCDFEQISELLASGKSARQKAQWLLAEHPQHERTVPGFWMMVSEVTNEQYRAFVGATGAQPPIRWARPAVDSACARFVEETGAERARAREAGEVLAPRQVFDEERWWQKNWRKSEWAMPAEVAAKPVVRITFEEASDYARWAGLRLPTEFEFERAVRGDGSNAYPWGPDWVRDQAATLEMEKTDELRDVGCFPDGANSQGIVDLIGSVWEWTDSPFDAYPGWTGRTVILEGNGLEHRVDDLPYWDVYARVTRGGSQSTDPLLSRASSRQGSRRARRSGTLGFRCVVSLSPQVEQGVVQVQSIPADVLPAGNAGPQTYAPEQSLLLHRWHRSAGTAQVPGYALITGHEGILFTPVEQTLSNGLSDLRKRTRPTELLHIGLLSTDLDLSEPPLPAGTYLVALRGAGAMLKRKQEEKARAEGLLPPSVGKQLGLDRKQDNLVFLDMTGTAILGVPTGGMSYGGPNPARVGWQRVPTLGTEQSTGTFELTYFVPGRSRNGLWGALQVQFTDPSPDQPWLPVPAPE